MARCDDRGCVRVHVVDPSAYTPPYDRALCAALARAGADVDARDEPLRLRRRAAAHAATRCEERFYRFAPGKAGSAVRFASKLAQHVPDMLRYRRAARDADVVHFQWLTVQPLDVRLLPTDASGRADRPRRHPARAAARAARRSGGSTSASTRSSCTPSTGASGWSWSSASTRRSVHVIRTARSTACTELEAEWALPVELAGGREAGRAVLRAAAALQGTRRAARRLARDRRRRAVDRRDAAHAARRPARCRAPQRALDARASSTTPRSRRCSAAPTSSCCPTAEIDQSGVLFTALAFGKPLLLSAVGGFPEVADWGRPSSCRPATAPRCTSRCAVCSTIPRGASGSRRAPAAAAGPYDWDAIAADHLRSTVP